MLYEVITISSYVKRHSLGNTVTEDLNRVIEEVTGRSWDRFLDQWVYHGGYPEVEVKYKWNEVALPRETGGYRSSRDGSTRQSTDAAE